MTELSNQIQARKARLQRFAEAATRYQNKGRAQTDIQQAAILDRYLMARPEPKPRLRREYEKPGQSSVFAPVTWRILQAVAAEFGITTEELRSPAREAKDCLPRYVAIGLFLRMTQMSLPAIGRRLGGRDHTTIINGRRRLEKLLEEEAFRNRFDQIEAEIGA